MQGLRSGEYSRDPLKQKANILQLKFACLGIPPSGKTERGSNESSRKDWEVSQQLYLVAHGCRRRIRPTVIDYPSFQGPAADTTYPIDLKSSYKGIGSAAL